MDLGLQEQVAVVIGGANGIGRAISDAFAAEGTHVAVLDVAENTSKIAAQVAETHGVRTVGTRCDIASLESVEASRKTVLGEFQSYDHLIVAAAIGSGKFGFPFLNLKPGDWERVFHVNVLGTTNWGASKTCATSYEGLSLPTFLQEFDDSGDGRFGVVIGSYGSLMCWARRLLENRRAIREWRSGSQDVHGRRRDALSGTEVISWQVWSWA